MVLRNSAQKQFAYFWQSIWVAVIAIEIERMQIHFLSDVFEAVAIVVSQTPYFLIRLMSLLGVQKNYSEVKQRKL